MPGATVALTADLGPIILDAGGSLLFDGAGDTIDAGGYSGLAVSAGRLELRNLALAGSGSVDIGSAATLELDAGMAAPVDFTGIGGKLRLDQPSGYGGVVGNLAGNTVELAGVSAKGGTIAGGTLSVTLTAGGTLSYPVSGAAGAVTVSENDGNAEIAIACFVAGTRIATPCAEMPVELLRIGDEVITASGGVERIRWIGRRRYAAAAIAADRARRPVRIAAGAFGAGLPRRDLFLSPQHALLLRDPEGEDVLVPAAQLVNGVSVARCDDCRDVTYFHIELTAHDAVLAEGQPAETFVDRNSRATFDNAGEYARLYREAVPAIMPFCAPRIEGGATLARIRAKIEARAGIRPGPLQGHLDRADDRMIEGWAFDPTNPACPVLLEILVDGRGWRTLLADQYRGDLTAMNGGHCGFHLPSLESRGGTHAAVRRAGDRRRLWSATLLKSDFLFRHSGEGRNPVFFGQWIIKILADTNLTPSNPNGQPAAGLGTGTRRTRGCPAFCDDDFLSGSRPLDELRQRGFSFCHSNRVHPFRSLHVPDGRARDRRSPRTAAGTQL